MKNKIITAVCIVLLFIPTYFAVFYYVNAQNAPVNVSVVSKMNVIDPMNETFEFEKTSKKIDEEISNISDNMIQFFLDMNASSKSEAELPDPLKGQETFTVSFISYDRETVYKYYFYNNTSESYYTDNEGNAFRIPEKYSSAFLMSEYARGLYPASQKPVFTLSGNTTIEPQKLSWEYLNYLDEYTTSSEYDDITTAIATYNIMGGTLTFDFSVEPDNIYVTITENGNNIFLGTYDNMESINLNEDATIKITVEASWYENTERGAKGSATYNFYGEVKAQPAFSLGKNIIEPGEFVVLTGQNIEDIADITFSSEPSLNYTPVFFEDGKFVHALIPVSYDLPEILEMTDTLQYTLRLTVYGKQYELSLNVKPKEFRSLSYVVPEIIATTKRTAKTIEEFEVAMARTYSSQETTKYWENGPFGFPMLGNEQVVSGFGTTRNIRYSSGGAIADSYRHEGTDFVVSYGTPNVCSINKGKVIYVGEQVLSGKIVVVDHGWGLKSTYTHLGEIKVIEGAIVEKGEFLGIAGSTGFANGVTVHLGLNVFDVPVSPYPLLWYDPEGIPMLK
jgi:Membrane proteins related to metalloendopeptidases